MTPEADFADWLLRPAEDRDIDEMMRWFPDPASTHAWGGPGFRFPFTRHSFAEDLHWGRMASFSLCRPDGTLAGFGQIYERDSRIHLARLVVAPDLRRRGAGHCLVERLLAAGAAAFTGDEFSLFVFRDNLPALRCYESAGFRMAAYPPGAPLSDRCFYLVRPLA